MKKVIKNILENNYFSDAVSCKQALQLALVKKIGLLKANEVLESIDDQINEYFAIREQEKAVARAERRANDPVMSRVMSYWDYKEKQKTR
jgi:hypothetical protein